jgi:hypothetical protein
MPEFIENIKPNGAPDAAKRPSHPESYLNTVYKCGERREHLVRIQRSKWPPKAMVGTPGTAFTFDRPYVTATCERCGGTCLVYDPPPSDMTVVLYGDASEAQGKVIDEAGPVVSEEELPQAGQVIDEPEPARRGRR